jgi:hypothetical protein
LSWVVQTLSVSKESNLISEYFSYETYFVQQNNAQRLCFCSSALSEPRPVPETKR